MTKSSRHSDHVDFARDVPTTLSDVVALRRARSLSASLLFVDWDQLSPVWPPPPDLAFRPTAEGRKPFEL